MDIFDVEAMEKIRGSRGTEVDCEMDQGEFAAGLIRLAHARFRQPALADRVKQLCVAQPVSCVLV